MWVSWVFFILCNIPPLSYYSSLVVVVKFVCQFNIQKENKNSAKKEDKTYNVCVCSSVCCCCYKLEFCISFWKMAQLIDCVFMCEWCVSECDAENLFFCFCFAFSSSSSFPFSTIHTTLADGIIKIKF